MKNKFTLFIIVLLVAVLISCKLTAQIISGNCFIQGQYVELGIGPCGTFGTTIDAPAGYHPRGGFSGNPFKLGFLADQEKNGWDVGLPNYCGDYYVPGTPEEGWGLTINGTDYNNNLLCEINDVPGGIIEYRNNGSTITGTWGGTINGLAIKAKTLVPIDKLYFLTEVTLKNTTRDTMRNIYYMRNIDPDNEVTLTGDYTTINTIVNQNPNSDNKAVVTAQGLLYGCFIALGTRDCRAKVSYGGFSNRSAANAWDCISPHQCSGSATDDIAITISFKLGDLAPGRQTSLKFVNVLNLADLDEAVDLTGPSFVIGNTDEINSGDTTQICSTGPTAFEVINTGGFDNWSWSPATGLNTTTGPDVICDGSIDTLNYVATGQNFCGGSISINFTAIKGIITHVPKAGPISGPKNLCLPNTTVTYTISPIPRAKKYQWQVPPGASILSGDGTTSITVNLGSAIIYDSISVYGTNVCGPGDTSLIRVAVCDCNTIYPVTPAAAFICPGDSVQLTTNDISGAIYKWYKNGVLLPVTGHTIYAKDTGNYDAHIFPNSFCTNNTSIARVDFTTPPVVTLSPSGKVYKCEGMPAAITANVIPNAPGDVILDWYKDGVLILANGPAVFNPADDGVYSVKITNSYQCKSFSNLDSVISRKLPMLQGYTFEGDMITCAGRNSKLKTVYSSEDGNVITYNWYYNNNLIPAAIDPILVVNNSGNYSVKLTSEYGCENILRDTLLVFHPTPVAGFENPNGCVVGNFTFVDTSRIFGGSIVNWIWKKDGTVFSNTQNPNTNFTPGTYQIQLTVKSDKGCVSDPNEISFLRYGKPSATFTFDGTCADSITRFSVREANPGYGNTSIGKWNWDFGNSLVSAIPDPSLTYGSAGYYTVKLAFSGNNCPAIEDTSIKKIYLGDPLPAMRYFNVIALESERFVLYGGGDGVSYNWYPSIGLASPNSRITSGMLNQSKIYNLHVINSYGCGRIDTVQVVILNDCKISIPTAFTPNNDGLNDNLRAFFGCLQTLNHFSIYNRWGQKIFTTKTSTQGWDGKYKGIDQLTGAYIWIAEGEFKSGKKFMEKGSFVLIR